MNIHFFECVSALFYFRNNFHWCATTAPLVVTGWRTTQFIEKPNRWLFHLHKKSQCNSHEHDVPLMFQSLSRPVGSNFEFQSLFYFIRSRCQTVNCPTRSTAATHSYTCIQLWHHDSWGGMWRPRTVVKEIQTKDWRRFLTYFKVILKPRAAVV